jgi:outer membrane protein TolC
MRFPPVQARAVCSAAALAILGACAAPPPTLLSPELRAFDSPVKAETETAREQYNKMWWTDFGLPELSDLIAEAVKDNFTVQAAELRLKEARGMDDASIWNLLPKASLQLTESEGAITQYQVNGYPNASSPRGIHPTSRGAVSMSWELPLFGKASATNALSVAQVDYARWTLEAAKDTVITELALSYVEALGTRAMYAALSEARDTAQKLVEEEAILRDAGMSSQGDVDRLEGQALDAESQMLEVQNRLATLHAKIGTLIGNPHSPALANLAPWRGTASSDATEVFDVVINRLKQRTRVDAVGMRHRFDVKIAEAKVAQAAAQSGLATANLYPQFTLEGALNLAKGSLDSTGVTKGFSSIGNLDLGLRIPLLDWFALKADSVAKKTEMQAVVMDYRATVLAAWEEATSTAAEASMALRQSQLATRQEQLARAEAARQDAAAAQHYVAARDSHQAHEAHSTALKAKLQAETNFLLSWTRLRKAAGGWLS